MISHSKKIILIGFIVGILFTLALLCGWVVFFHSSFVTGIDRDSYQAVFLTNGLVYFGNLQMLLGDYAVLTHVYYMQGSVIPALFAAGQESEVRLVKLGSELHGPQDAMYIAKDQILFYENLRPDSRAVGAINTYNQ